MADIMETDPSSGIHSSEDEREEEEEIQVESLVQGRAKRSNAGLRMSALIDAAADDDLTLLFEEVEDDNEFAMEENADEEEMALDSSSDDDDDQGPNAQNDFEGEKQLQKDERKKRRAQNDLRFQTLRKRVKIDPTAVSAIPAPPRPKKKSERISWLPTVEDGPTRSSSRRQTMVNKEMTHARLKDSQEKRVRIIATMEEAAKRKAHLKPKKMTQEDHLAEAERIERTNSKSLNRWEQAERRKADERRARIEALQNRRLDGPVMSYWSGMATWVNGRLTRVGKAEIKAKPEKEVAKKKKAEKGVKSVDAQGASTDAAVALTDPSAAPVPTPTPAATDPSTALPTTQSTDPAQPRDASNPTPTPTPAAVSDAPTPVAAAEQKPPHDTHTQANPAPETTTPSTAPTNEPTKPDEKTSAETPLEQQNQQPNDKPSAEDTPQQSPTEEKSANREQSPKSDVTSTPPRRKSSLGHSLPVVGIINRRKSTTAISPAPDEESAKPAPAESADPMDIDKRPEVELATQPEEPPTTTETNPPSKSTDTPTDSADTVQNDSTSAPVPSAEQVTSQSATSTTTPLAAQPPSADAAPLSSAPPEINATESRPSVAGPDGPAQDPAADETPTQPEHPPVIEHTGRTLTILENFDDRTANSKKYSIYFTARKPRLAKISSSLCVITSLPSRYRDPETSLPYANSYAYGQIRRLQAQGYIWSAMLGCFVGPADVAARGVPARFLGGEKSAEEIELQKKEKEKAEKEKAEKEQAEKEKAEQAKKQEASKGASASTATGPVKDGVTTSTTAPSAEPIKAEGGE